MAEQIDRLEIQIEAQATKANQQLNNLIDKLGKVSDSLTKVNSSGLTGLANGVQKFSNASATLKQVNTADFTRLAKNIGNLSSINTEKIYSAASSMTILGKSLTNLGAVSQSSMQIADVAKSISKIGGANVQKAITNLPLLATAMKELMQTLSGAPRVNENIIQMTNALARLSSQGAKVGTASKSLSAGMERYSTSASKATASTKGLASSIGMFYAKCFLAIRAVKALGKAVESSMDFLETSNYFEVAFGKIGGDAAAEWQKAGKENAEAYAQSFSERAKELTAKMTGYIIDESGNAMSSGMKNLGLNPDDVMQWQAVYAQMTDSLGIAEESTLRFSKALTMLGTDWASLRNISLDTSWNKFASALAGQSRAVRSLGIDVTQTTLQEYALGYGITKSVMAMNQAEKAQLRLLAMLRQSEVAFGDLANTIGSPSNQLRILEQNFANLARSIGNLFLPIVTKVLPYINGLVIALQRLFQWVGALLGIKFSSINSAMGGMDDSMGDFVGGAEDAGDALDKANAAAKKLKSTVLGIDELNINAPQEASGGSGGSAGGAGGGSAILDAEIEKALAEYEKKWNEAFDRMENKAQEFADRIANAFKKIWDVAEPTREALSRLWNEGLAQLEKFTWGTLGDFYEEFLVPVGKWMLGNGLPRFLDITNDLLKKIDWNKLRKSLDVFYKQLAKIAKFTFTGILDFYEYFLAPVAKWTMSKAIPILVDALTDLSGKINWGNLNSMLSSFWQVLSKFAIGIGDGLIYFLEAVYPLLNSAVSSVINGIAIAFGALFDAIALIPDSVLVALGGALGGVLSVVMTYKGAAAVMDGISTAWTALYTVFDDGLKLLMMHPYLAVAAGIGAVVGGLAALQKEAQDREEIALYGQTVQDLTREFANNREEIEKRAKAASEYVDGAGVAEIAYAQDLKDKYFELANKQNKSNEEYALMQNYVSQLQEIIPGLNEHINEETGLLDIQADSLQELIDKQKEYYKVQAAKDKIIDLYQAQFDMQNELKENTDAVKKAQEEYNKQLENEAKLNKDYFENMGIKRGEESVSLQDARENLIKLNEELSNSVAAYDEISASIDEMSAIIAEQGSGFETAGNAHGEEYTKGVADSINKEMGWVSSATKGIASKINEEMGWKSVGADGGKGYAEGMESQLSVIEDAAKTMAEAGILATQTAQDSNSPSKVYMGLAKDAVDGYNLGWSENTQSTVDTINEWMNTVLGSFTQDKWYEMFSGMPLGFQTKWSELTVWWSETALPLWFEEGVSPWFTEEKWLETTDGMKLGIESKWSEFAEQWKLNIAKWWSTDVTPWFSLAKWQMFGENMKNGLYLGFEGIVQSIAGILNSLNGVFEYSMNQIVDAVNDFVKDYNEAAGIMGTDKLERFSHFSFADLPKYEAGGFPEDGLFFANHTELVGEFTNGRTAVANNDMITAGIEEAAYRGFSRAYSENDREASLLEELIEAVREGRSISIDGRELVSVYDDRKRRNGYQFT